MVFCSKIKNFCFLCGKLHCGNIKPEEGVFKDLFQAYYKNTEWIVDDYVPDVGCSKCYMSLKKWKSQEADKEPKFKPKYKELMTWFNPGGHKPEECYFCVSFVPGISVPKQASVQ